MVRLRRTTAVHGYPVETDDGNRGGDVDTSTSQRLPAPIVIWSLARKIPSRSGTRSTSRRHVLSYAAGKCGLSVIVDLVHYGTPTWLPRSFGDPSYPAVVAE